LKYAKPGISKLDAEIAEKGYFWMKTGWFSKHGKVLSIEASPTIWSQIRTADSTEMCVFSLPEDPQSCGTGLRQKNSVSVVKYPARGGDGSKLILMDPKRVIYGNHSDR
jgi:hypothetical protein